jgi:hypothetical protein
VSRIYGDVDLATPTEATRSSGRGSTVAADREYPINAIRTPVRRRIGGRRVFTKKFAPSHDVLRTEEGTPFCERKRSSGRDRIVADLADSGW